MLNLETFDMSGRKHLENSYRAFKNKEDIIIVTGDEEKQVFRTVIDNIQMPNAAVISFQNLFKLKSNDGQFYVAQCLLDFGYPIGTKGTQTFERKYYYQVMAFANLKADFGRTYIRPETKFDKLIGRFFDYDIDIDGAQKFNDKYFLQSNKKEEISNCFDSVFLNTLAKYNGVLISIKHNQLFLSFATKLNTNQTRIAQDILSNFKYCADELTGTA